MFFNFLKYFLYVHFPNYPLPVIYFASWITQCVCSLSCIIPSLYVYSMYDCNSKLCPQSVPFLSGANKLYRKNTSTSSGCRWYTYYSGTVKKRGNLKENGRMTDVWKLELKRKTKFKRGKQKRQGWARGKYFPIAGGKYQCQNRGRDIVFKPKYRYQIFL